MYGDDSYNSGTTSDDSQQTPDASAPAAPSQPIDTTATPVADTTASSPVVEETPVTTSVTDDTATTTPAEPVADDITHDIDKSDDSGLDDIKKQALEQLTPIVGKLEQSPEDKFRTTMMMIQASDNQSLIKDAYVAAQAITDEKEKAQALLDIINEINYFTQSKEA